MYQAPTCEKSDIMLKKIYSIIEVYIEELFIAVYSVVVAFL